MVFCAIYSLFFEAFLNIEELYLICKSCYFRMPKHKTYLFYTRISLLHSSISQPIKQINSKLSTYLKSFSLQEILNSQIIDIYFQMQKMHSSQPITACSEQNQIQQPHYSYTTSIFIDCKEKITQKYQEMHQTSKQILSKIDISPVTQTMQNVTDKIKGKASLFKQNFINFHGEMKHIKSELPSFSDIKSGVKQKLFSLF